MMKSKTGNLKRVSIQLLWVTLTLLLTACNNSTGNTPLNVTDNHEHHHDHVSHPGRLAIVPRDSQGDLLARLYFYDLAKDRVLPASIGLNHAPSALNLGPGHRFILAAQRQANAVQIIANGLHRHGDHVHAHAPELVATLHGPRPTHYRVREDRAVLFFDGERAKGWNSEVMMFTPHSLEHGEAAARHRLPGTHHGVAVPFGGLMLVTNNVDQSILPEKVNVLHQHKHHYHLEGTLARKCPGLHGAGANEQYAVFGCSDGILVVHFHHGTFSAEHWNNAKLGLHGSERIGHFSGYHGLETLIGYAGDHVIVINPAQGTARPLHWKEGAQVHLDAHMLSPNGEFLLLLDSKGYLHIYDTHDWSEHGHLKVIDPRSAAPPLPPHAHGSRFSMTVSAEPVHAYIADAGHQRIVVVDVEEATIEKPISLSIKPGIVKWTGLPSVGGHHH